MSTPATRGPARIAAAFRTVTPRLTEEAAPSAATSKRGGRRPTILVNHLVEPKDRSSGITRYTFELIRALIRRNGGRYVVMTSWSRDRIRQELGSDVVEIISLPEIRSKLLSVLLQSVVVPAICLAKRVDAVFHPTPIGSFLDSWPRVVTVHDLYFENAPRDYVPRHVAIWRVLFPRILAAAKTVIAVSEATAHDIARHYPRATGKVCVIPEASCIDPSHREPSGLQGPYALFVCSVAPNKNPGCVAQAMARLRARGVDLRLYHVGNDVDGQVRSAAREAGCEDSLIPVGQISDAALVDAYSRAVCLVIPSLREGFCLPALESQACGTPVLAADIPVLREVCGRGADYFDPKNPEQLADLLASLLAPDRREELAARARENEARFSWAAAAEATEAALLSVVKTNNRAPLP